MTSAMRNGKNVIFPVLLECGVIPKVKLEASGPFAAFEYATMSSQVAEDGRHELVIRCRVKCLHPSHVEKP